MAQPACIQCHVLVQAAASPHIPDHLSNPKVMAAVNVQTWDALCWTQFDLSLAGQH